MSTTPSSGGSGRTTPLSRPVASSPTTALPRTSSTPDPRLTQGARPVVSEPGGLVSGLLVLFRWIQSSILGAWLGALAMMVYVAISAQHGFSDRVAAGKFLAPFFKVLIEAGIGVGIAVLILLFLHDGLWKRYHHTAAGTLLTFLRFVLAAGLVGACGYLLFRVTPLIERYQAIAPVAAGHLAGKSGGAFDYWHQLYTQVVGACGIAALALLLLTHMSSKRR